MCGISGIWNLNSRPVAKKTIERFNNTLAHRGPDGFGIYTDDRVGLALGHRRLSILDLSEAGKQPMASPSGRYIIIYNGEVFNFLELRQELEKFGYHFKTECDTEVILAAWEKWGNSCWEKFNGMWGIAIWDKEVKTLTLSRDRFGIKPLYFLYIPNQIFAFASETIAFKQLDGFDRLIDQSNMGMCLKDPYYLEAIGDTVFKGIKKVSAGTYGTLSAAGELEFTKWWSTENYKVQVPATYKEQVEQFRELLTDACRIRLRSDVPIATALSGGLDSSSVYSTINQIKKNSNSVQRLPGDWQKAVIATFPGTSMDERDYATEVVKFTNGKALYVVPDNNSITDSIIDEVKREDFIYFSPPVVHNIYKMMKENGITVSLDGHGVDEMIFGYPHDLLKAGNNIDQPSKKKEILETYSGLVGRPYKEIEQLYFPKKNLSHFAKRAWNKIKPAAVKEPSWILEDTIIPNKYYEEDGTGNTDKLYRIPYRLFHVNSLPALLRNWDLASMRHGVEIRMPFMDWRLVTYVFNLPFEAKVAGGFSKRILRDAMEGIMPESVRKRTFKLGINAPMQEWFAGPLNKFVMDAVNSDDFIQSDIWEGKRISAYVNKMNSEKTWNTNDCMRVWPFINAWLLMRNGN